MSAEIPLPPYVDAPTSSALVQARDLIVSEMQVWGADVWEADVRGHAGACTIKFLREQSVMTPTAVVTALGGKPSRISGGRQVTDSVKWAVYLVIGGRLEDRTIDGLWLAGEMNRFIQRAPWGDVDPGPFATATPAAGSHQWEPLYKDADEGGALSIWGFGFIHDVDMASAGRQPDVLEPLTRIDGKTTLTRDQTDVAMETEVV